MCQQGEVGRLRDQLKDEHAAKREWEAKANLMESEAKRESRALTVTEDQVPYVARILL
jgi:hypothetical protein